MEIDIDISQVYNNMPFTVAEVKEHLRVLHSNEDNYIESLMKAAVQKWWESTRYLVADSTLEVEVTENITDFRYDDKITVTARPIKVDNKFNVVKIKAGERESSVEVEKYKRKGNWTNVYMNASDCDGVEVTYTLKAATNEDAKQAILLMIGDMYERRSDHVQERITAVDRVIRKYQSWVH